MIFNSDVTICNFYNGSFFKTHLTGVELQNRYSARRLPGVNETDDRCLLIIKFDPTQKATNDGYRFLYPKEWENLEGKDGYFTIQTDRDFFIMGDFSNSVITDFDSFKNDHPNITFLINEFREYTSVLPHWEIWGN